MNFSLEESADSVGKRILVIILGGGIGDLLLSSVVINPLKEYFKNSSLSLMIRRGMEDIFEGNELVDKLFLLDSPLSRENFSYWLARIKDGHFDVGIVLWSGAQEAKLLYRAGIPVRVGSGSKIFYSFLFTHKVRVRSEHGDSVTHWTDIMLDYIRILNIPVGTPQVIFPVSPELISEMKKKIVCEAEALSEPYWGFHFSKGFNLAGRKWPVRHFAAIADKVIDEFGGTAVFIGTSQESSIVSAIIGEMKNPSVDMSGKTSLKEVAALMPSFKGLVSTDSGPGHIGAVMGIPVVSIFALKSDFPDRWKPYGKKVACVIPAENRCRLKCIKEKCSSFECYTYITPMQVAEKFTYFYPELRLKK